MPDRIRVIVTESEKDSIEKEWQEYFASKQAESFFSGGIISDEEFQEEKRLLLSKGINKSNPDIVWGLLNKKLYSLMKEKDWFSMGQVYYAMAQSLQREGKDCFRVLQESGRCKLMELKKDGVTTVKILTAGKDSSCEKCWELDGKKFNIETALQTMPIPVKECSTEVFVDSKGFCRCLYVAGPE